MGIACSHEQRSEAAPTPERSVPDIADRFIYPIGDADSTTQARDRKDAWYNAQDFGKNRHLGEDWNRNSGGNSDCGEPVRAAANGLITFAKDAGPGWGNVVIVTHRLPDRSEVQTLYGHLEKIERTTGKISIGERIGSVGNADGTYLCHLHFELRERSNRYWDTQGPGYADDRRGWLDPSDFIDKRLKGASPR